MTELELAFIPKTIGFREKVDSMFLGKAHVAQCLHTYRIAMERIVDDLVMSGAEWNNPAIRACKPFVAITGDVMDRSRAVAYKAAHPRDLSHVLGLILGLRGLPFGLDSSSAP